MKLKNQSVLELRFKQSSSVIKSLFIPANFPSILTSASLSFRFLTNDDDEDDGRNDSAPSNDDDDDDDDDEDDDDVGRYRRR